ncbi:MAG: porin family protein, partial [Prevotella pallens]|nr:porin family protein [Prevotella pallens]
MKRILSYILFLMASVPILAQDGEEYRMELGAG